VALPASFRTGVTRTSVAHCVWFNASPKLLRHAGVYIVKTLDASLHRVQDSIPARPLGFRDHASQAIEVAGPIVVDAVIAVSILATTIRREKF
jgi:hypothetical protein